MTAESALFTEAMRAVPEAAVAAMCAGQWGVAPLRVSRLTGERDQNFRIVADDGRQYVFKVTHPSEPADAVALQSSAFRHMAAVAPALPLQRLVPTLDGADAGTWRDGDGAGGGARPSVARLFTWLDGTPQHTLPGTPAVRRSLGVLHAKLGAGLRSLDHAALDHRLLWDLKRMDRVGELLAHVESKADRALARSFLDRYEAHVAPQLPDLRCQWIHNDLNPYNVLVDPGTGRVCGILDLGDIVFAPLLNDIAIAASYLVADEGPALAGVTDYLAAYHGEVPLTRLETALLYDLIAARLVMTVAITGWRARLHPANSDYILRNNAQAWRGLSRLADLSAAEAELLFSGACRGDASDE